MKNLRKDILKNLTIHFEKLDRNFEKVVRNFEKVDRNVQKLDKNVEKHDISGLTSFLLSEGKRSNKTSFLQGALKSG